MNSLDLHTEPDLDDVTDPEEEGRTRTTGVLAIGCIIAFGALLVLLNTVADSRVVTASVVNADLFRSAMEADSHRNRYSGLPPSRLVLSHVRLLDTVYTTDSVYLEVDLVKQNVTVHKRDGGKRTFLVSSGNKFIRDGMATPPGVFTVQNMTPMAISRQFNNARLHHWIGVQGGIGFHGLDGSGYYWNLGKRPSSHGCIRMSREEIKQMYGLVHPGALIMVHHGKPARVVAFCDPADTLGATLIDSASVFNRNLGRERLRTLYEGKAWVEPQPRLVHLARQRLRWGMEIGEASRIGRQKLPQAFSLAKAYTLMPDAPEDRVAVSAATQWKVDALRAADSLIERQRDEWKKEKEPEYGD